MASHRSETLTPVSRIRAPRSRRALQFAAPLVTILGGCDLYIGNTGNPPAPPDSSTDSWTGSENPPPPTLGNECMAQGKLGRETECEEYVCNDDPGCCADIWDERCTELAAAECGSLYCYDTVAFAGDLGVAFVHDAGGWVPSRFETGDAAVVSTAWADRNGDWVPDLATLSDCTGRVFVAGQETETYPASDCATFHGRRVRWANLDGSGRLDPVFAGDGGAFWSGGTIVPAADGVLGDLAITDLDGDGDGDAIAAFTVGAARLYRQTAPGVFTRDDSWQSTLTGHTTVALCAIDPIGPTSVVLGGTGGVEIAHRQGDGLAPGVQVASVPDATDLACGRLGSNPYDQLVTVSADGAIRIVDPVNGVRWTSTTDVVPPLAATGAHVTTAAFYPGFGRDVVISVPGTAGDVPFLTVHDNGSGFTVGVEIDPAPDRAAGQVISAGVRYAG